jgi:hypothetical protein
VAAVRSAVNCDVQGGRGDALARALRSLALRLAAMSVVPDVRAATGTLRPRARQPRCRAAWQLPRVAKVPCNLTPRHPPSQVVDNLPRYG